MEGIKKVANKTWNWAKEHKLEIGTVAFVYCCMKIAYNNGYVNGYIKCVCDVLEDTAK